MSPFLQALPPLPGRVKKCCLFILITFARSERADSPELAATRNFNEAVKGETKVPVLRGSVLALVADEGRVYNNVFVVYGIVKDNFPGSNPMPSQLTEVTFDICLQPGEALNLPTEISNLIGPGHWVLSLRPVEYVEANADRPIRNHAAFLNGYAPEDEGLYDEYSAR